MKKILYRLPLGIILIAGMFIGMAKGQDVKQKWVSKMKHRYETYKATHHAQEEVILDEIEMATYHS